MLGFAYHQQGDSRQGIALIQQALALKPELPSAYYHLGIILHLNNRVDDAIRHYETAIALLPNSAEVLLNLGTAYYSKNRTADAIRCLDQAMTIDPTNADIYYNKGVVVQSLNRLDEARQLYEKALTLKPTLGSALVNLGNILQSLNRHTEAIEFYQKAIAINVNHIDAHMNLGNSLQALNRFEEALRANAKAAALGPDYALAQMNFGSALQALNRYDDAIQCFARALSIDPELAAAQMNFGTGMQGLARYEEAMSRYDKALALAPDFHEAKWNKALLCLTLGQFPEGWELYEARWPAGIKGMVERKYSQQRWNGEQLDGTLMIWGEQGLGDQILYASMIPDLATRAKRILFEVEPRLVPLFARSFSGVDVVPLAEELYAGHIDRHEPVIGLGRYFRTSWDSFPQRSEGYLIADRERTQTLRLRLKTGPEVVVGLSWRSYNPVRYRSKTARLQDFEALLRTPGLRFVDLQYGDTSEERAAFEQMFGVRVERLADIDNTLDIDGLASLISACDLVVTVSNTTAHLAGALGKPTWVMVPRGNARLWYWFTDEVEQPWYPRVKLRRKTMEQSWSMMAEALTSEIVEFVKTA